MVDWIGYIISIMIMLLLWRYYGGQKLVPFCLFVWGKLPNASSREVNMLLGSVLFSVAETGLVFKPFSPLFKNDKTQPASEKFFAFYKQRILSKENSDYLIICNILCEVPHYFPETFHFIQVGTLNKHNFICILRIWSFQNGRCSFYRKLLVHH